jgi:prevent-host-death family protein
MVVFNTYDAKAKLSELLKRAQNGEDIVIAHAGKAIVRLVAVAPAKKKSPSRLGLALGQFKVDDDFNDPMFTEFMK